MKAQNSDVDIINIRVPKEIVKWLDSLIERGVYSNRSEAVREFSREFVQETKTQQK